MLGSVHHIGYLVKDINKSMNAFGSLGYEIETNPFYDAERMSNFCFMTKDDTRVELVEPAKESDIFPLLKTYNNCIYHMCYRVKDIDIEVSELKKQGYLLFRDKQAAPAISETAVVVFLMHSRMGIIELLQEGEK
ncbi:Glyoxalase/Bleomycin resistance protein/Dioxygenase superfamily protein [Eubacterium ruminantium]|jgi:methylmalonyl-CoA/ethylmalonyl-CoA epimerase|uniref:Glyoxalase/Bleomycin resistance protein/Dioxygenase superfamily protein n=1 Tax=Eubacterium ruminantium TaxID=42322 RepID=A0A1T4K729_9FIRM|nr:VOC family protein [Eubacterium ruminantium]SCW27257.1 Glyoxalase/Bleomycin resistance protein/Dioxygenase superfamily protein [Eubacterium ruminantium]SDM15548.1 methylmalonyl-CoA epimerase [Eubacterium ruminantium]SJZ38137.1 Glyoxalase/Bleomycin resistance protein/Dioxygenase superfamily protein [Eubacterium ruminantium]